MDDLFGKKKDSTPILDLSKTVANSKEEFRKLFERVPDFKIRVEKIRPEDIKIRTKNFSFKLTKKERKQINAEYSMDNPIPIEMKQLKLEDLAKVTIDWKMLTNIRPKLKLDEEFYSRLVELKKSELKSIERERRELLKDNGIRKTKNRAGIVETRAISCLFCGEEFCNGKYCKEFSYDNFTRVETDFYAANATKTTSNSNTQALMDSIPTGKKVKKPKKVGKKKSSKKNPEKTKKKH